MRGNVKGKMKYEWEKAEEKPDGKEPQRGGIPFRPA